VASGHVEIPIEQLLCRPVFKALMTCSTVQLSSRPIISLEDLVNVQQTSGVAAFV
jgi:hypothetical protein